ncbi:MAG: efflux RND transporter periplasmic adaptor subunit, partial [Gammaproteobacteria bacterium]|nr:efflux RND transporter periplasmic adaptor subunit [Gammaproteobacteria bacterium]
KQGVLYIPREALIRTGTRQRVILALGEGRYQAREVVAGLESGEFVEIISGLAEGKEVVVSGQFLIDSEASLKASLMRMSAPTQERQGLAEKGTGQGGER